MNRLDFLRSLVFLPVAAMSPSPDQPQAQATVVVSMEIDGKKIARAVVPHLGDEIHRMRLVR